MKPQMANLGIPLGLLLAALIVLAVCARWCEEAGFGGLPGPKPHLSLPPWLSLSHSQSIYISSCPLALLYPALLTFITVSSVNFPGSS